MHKNLGRLKEDEIVLALNDKKANELSHNLKHILREMFGLFDGEHIVKAGLVENFQKPDFYIEVNGVRKYVSLKSGRANKLGEEKLKSFLLFLRSKGISKRSQQTFLYNHFGDGTLDGSGKERFDYNYLRVKLANRIKELNEEFNYSKEFIKDVVIRCMFKGPVESNIEADYIYHGDVNYGTICSKTQILKHLDRRDWDFMDNPHIGPIQFRPHARYIGKEIKNEERRWEIDFWWANLGADLDYIAERYDG